MSMDIVITKTNKGKPPSSECNFTEKIVSFREFHRIATYCKHKFSE